MTRKNVSGNVSNYYISILGRDMILTRYHSKTVNDRLAIKASKCDKREYYSGTCRL